MRTDSPPLSPAWLQDLLVTQSCHYSRRYKPNELVRPFALFHTQSLPPERSFIVLRRHHRIRHCPQFSVPRPKIRNGFASVGIHVNRRGQARHPLPIRFPIWYSFQLRLCVSSPPVSRFRSSFYVSFASCSVAAPLRLRIWHFWLRHVVGNSEGKR